MAWFSCTGQVLQCDYWKCKWVTTCHPIAHHWFQNNTGSLLGEGKKGFELTCTQMKLWSQLYAGGSKDEH